MKEGDIQMLTLQPFTVRDFEQLIRWLPNAAHTLQWGGPAFSYPLTPLQLHQYTYGANKEEATTYIFKAVHTVTHEVIGHISISRVDRLYKRARIGKVLIAPQYRGHGYGKQLMNAALTYAFVELSLQHVTLGVFHLNETAINCYTQLGFKEERFIENARAYEHTYWHLIEMGVTKDTWLAAQHAVKL